MTDTTSAPIWWKTPVALWILLGVAAVLVGYAFMDTIQDMVYRWDTRKNTVMAILSRLLHCS